MLETCKTSVRKMWLGAKPRVKKCKTACQTTLINSASSHEIPTNTVQSRLVQNPMSNNSQTTFRIFLFGVAEREGFEPSIWFPIYTRSRRAPSTTRPPLLKWAQYKHMKSLFKSIFAWWDEILQNKIIPQHDRWLAVRPGEAIDRLWFHSMNFISFRKC